MKLFNWIQKNKYPLMVTAFFIVLLFLIVIFIQSLKKDHSLDMVKQELKLKEESRVLIEKERTGWEQLVKTKDEQIITLQIRDSLINENNIIIENRLQSLPKQYNEKANKITSYGSADLLEYFNNLPAAPDNDY